MYSPLSVSREWEVVMNECGVEDYSSVMRWLVVGAGKIQLDVNSSHTYVSRGVWCKQPELTSIILFCRFANWPNYQDKSRQDCASGTVEAPWLKFYIKLYFFLKNRI